MKIVGIIPARLSSKRFPNKLFYKFQGKTILENVIDRGLQLGFLDKIVVVTEDIKVKNFVKTIYAGADVKVFTSEKCRCGTEKVYKYFQFDDSYDYYFYMPSDEPYYDVNQIKLNSMLEYDISTFYTKFFNEEDLKSILSCKIIIDNDGCMLYNSRSIIPISKDGTLYDLTVYNKHLGLFMFSKNFLRSFGEYVWSNYKSEIADIEGLEQNRFVDMGIKVKMIEINHIGFGIDQKFQIKLLEERIKETK